MGKRKVAAGSKSNGNGANLGFEAKLWLAAKDEGADPEDADEYRAENVFWVPKEARWAHLQGKAKQATIGKLVDEAMVAIERDNPRLKGILPRRTQRHLLSATSNDPG